MSSDPANIHAAAVVADTHNDLLMAVVARPPRQWATYFRERWLPQLRDGGVDIQVLPVFVGRDHGPETALRQTMRMLEAAHRIAEDNAAEVTLCRSGNEIDAALAGGRIALVLALEGCPGIDTDLELFATVHRLGVRIVSIAHMGRSVLADGSGEDATGGRLTQPGIAAVEELARLGMLFDVSHLGAAGLAHVLEISTGPVIATHSSARSLHDHHRNLTDAQLAAIAKGGGVVCVNFFAPFLHATEHTMDKLVDHLEHVASVAGIDNVGIGPDFIREVTEDLTPPWRRGAIVSGIDPMACVPGLEGPRGLPLVTEALLRRGFTEENIRKVLGGNVLALLRKSVEA